MYRRQSDGMWCQKIKEGDHYRVVYGKTQRELKEKLMFAKPKTQTFGSVALEWWGVQEEKLAPTGARTYYAALKRAIEGLGSEPIDSLRPVDMMRWLNKVIEENNMAMKTARTHLCILKSVYHHAVMKGYMDYDPTSGLKLPDGLKRTRRELPSSEDIKRIKESENCPMKLLAIMALYTGLRRGELMALRREDISLENRTIKVERACQNNGSSHKIKDPKTEAGKRIVGIPDSLLPYLQDLPDGYIFSRNGNFLTENEFQWAWEKYQKKNGIKCTPHQLRHAYTTALIEMGIPPEEAMRLVGHANIATTLNVYTHLRQQRAEDLARKTLSLEYNP